MGKSLEHHYTKSGQNPIEPARLGCKILHGPNIENFRDVYKFLKKIGITNQVNNKKELYNYLLKNINLKKNKSNNQKKINERGEKILNRTFVELKKVLDKNDN
jgi:3-deoxy-D-manno-octulosonic-acid transferase